MKYYTLHMPSLMARRMLHEQVTLLYESVDKIQTLID